MVRPPPTDWWSPDASRALAHPGSLRVYGQVLRRRDEIADGLASSERPTLVSLRTAPPGDQGLFHQPGATRIAVDGVARSTVTGLHQFQQPGEPVVLGKWLLETGSGSQLLPPGGGLAPDAPPPPAEFMAPGPQLGVLGLDPRGGVRAVGGARLRREGVVRLPLATAATNTVSRVSISPAGVTSLSYAASLSHC